MKSIWTLVAGPESSLLSKETAILMGVLLCVPALKHVSVRKELAGDLGPSEWPWMADSLPFECLPWPHRNIREKGATLTVGEVSGGQQ